MPSTRVSRKASLVNRATCGGPIKAGLAPRATNFMFGNRSKPNVHKVTDYPFSCWFTQIFHELIDLLISIDYEGISSGNHKAVLLSTSVDISALGFDVVDLDDAEKELENNGLSFSNSIALIKHALSSQNLILVLATQPEIDNSTSENYLTFINPTFDSVAPTFTTGAGYSSLLESQDFFDGTTVNLAFWSQAPGIGWCKNKIAFITYSEYLLAVIYAIYLRTGGTVDGTGNSAVKRITLPLVDPGQERHRAYRWKWTHSDTPYPGAKALETQSIEGINTTTEDSTNVWETDGEEKVSAFLDRNQMGCAQEEGEGAFANFNIGDYFNISSGFGDNTYNTYNTNRVFKVVKVESWATTDKYGTVKSYENGKLTFTEIVNGQSPQGDQNPADPWFAQNRKTNNIQSLSLRIIKKIANEDWTKPPNAAHTYRDIFNDIKPEDGKSSTYTEISFNRYLAPTWGAAPHDFSQTNPYIDQDTEVEAPWIVSEFMRRVWDKKSATYMPDVEIGFVATLNIKDNNWGYYGWQGTQQGYTDNESVEPDRNKVRFGSDIQYQVGSLYRYPDPDSGDYDVARLCDSFYARGPGYQTSEAFTDTVLESTKKTLIKAGVPTIDISPYYDRNSKGLKFFTSPAYENQGPMLKPGSDENEIVFEPTSLGSNADGYKGTKIPFSYNENLLDDGNFENPTGTSGQNGVKTNPHPNLYQVHRYMSEINYWLLHKCDMWNESAGNDKIVTFWISDSEGGTGAFNGELPCGFSNPGPNGDAQYYKSHSLAKTWIGPKDKNTAYRDGKTRTFEGKSLRCGAPFVDGAIDKVIAFMHFDGTTYTMMNSDDIDRPEGGGICCSNQDYVNAIWASFTQKGQFKGWLPRLQASNKFSEGNKWGKRGEGSEEGSEEGPISGQWGYTSSNCLRISGTPFLENGNQTPSGYEEYAWPQGVGPAQGHKAYYNVTSGLGAAAAAADASNGAPWHPQVGVYTNDPDNLYQSWNESGYGIIKPDVTPSELSKGYDRVFGVDSPAGTPAPFSSSCGEEQSNSKITELETWLSYAKDAYNSSSTQISDEKSPSEFLWSQIYGEQIYGTTTKPGDEQKPDGPNCGTTMRYQNFWKPASDSGGKGVDTSKDWYGMFSIESTDVALCENGKFVDGNCGSAKFKQIPNCLHSWFDTDAKEALHCDSQQGCGIANYFGYWDLGVKTDPDDVNFKKNKPTLMKFIQTSNSGKGETGTVQRFVDPHRGHEVDSDDAISSTETTGMTNISIYETAFFPNRWVQESLDYLKEKFSGDSGTSQYKEFVGVGNSKLADVINDFDKWPDSTRGDGLNSVDGTFWPGNDFDRSFESFYK